MYISSLKKFLLYFKAPSVANSLLTFLICGFLFLALPVEGLIYIFSLEFPEVASSFFQFVNELCCTDVVSFAGNFSVNGKSHLLHLPYIFFIKVGSNILFAVLCAIFLQPISQIRLQDIGVTCSREHGCFLKKFGIALASGLGFLFLIILALNVLHLSFGMNISFQSDPPGKVYIHTFITPYSEEFFSRGILFALLRRHHWRISSIIICSGLLFGFTHFLVGIDFLFSTYTIIVGIYLGWLYHKTGSIVWPFLVHISGNALIQIVALYPEIMELAVINWS